MFLSRRRNRRGWPQAAIPVLFLIALFAKPSDLGQRHGSEDVKKDSYFKELNQTLKLEAHGLPCALIDLDRLDQNIQTITSRLRPARTLRVVVKSLPSLELLKYILSKTGTRHLMVFHGPQIGYLMRELKNLGDLDILLGKPMPAEAARAILVETPAAAEHVQWLVDTSERLDEYLKIAKDLKTKLKISVEIDVGMRRGGIRTADELKALLARLAQNPRELSFSGTMGYDGHVPHAPASLSFGQQRAIRLAFKDTLERYSNFASVLPGDHTQLTLNSGGSRTYSFYEGVESPINDLAMGSAFVKPRDFDDPSLEAHQDALYLAVPILKKLSTPSIPFLEPFWNALKLWDPNIAQGFYLYGALWDTDIAYPHGLRPGWFYEPTIRNLLPNQSLVSGSASVQANVGDYLFLRPREGDGMVVFQNILAVRAGKVVEKWKPLPFLN